MSYSARPLQTMKLIYDDTVAIVTLSRPDAMNAMNGAFFEDFQDILSELRAEANPVRALLITAEGKGFCAGADLKDQAGDMPPDLAILLRKNYNPLIMGLKNLPIPTIVAINGATAGAGMSLVCACDIAIAAKQAYFLQAFVNIGLIPDAGSTYFLPRMIGRARAVSMMMLGEKLSAEEAVDFGIISKVVDQDDLMTEAMTLAQKLSKMPTKALVSIRKLLDSSEENTLEQQLETEAVAQQTAGHSPDFMEGVMAFLQKRPPVFQGK
ncbi:MAG: 2-(1,2-epoxy-1,2-dihydrophenyl)acetyl-CoA isomerase [Alphaproteobacteria bacterium]|nr:MAG: 2-(1,2-epoxy-1,2-dihydrophenyl)acetyl-CoA isomerase [Alphaproteobacteria bacterium]